MDKQEICERYQEIVREAFPRAVVRPCDNQWNPYKDESYYAFFIPDSAAADYMDRWYGDNGWGARAEKLGLPDITLMNVSESNTRKHYSHLFPEIFGEKVKGSAKSKKSKVLAKTAKTRVARTKTAASRN